MKNFKEINKAIDESAFDRNIECAPNYYNDLNSCALFEELIKDNERHAYIDHLLGSPRDWSELRSIGDLFKKLVCATAPQRCEAYLRLKGKWVIK